jgi:hypothetical protein
MMVPVDVRVTEVYEDYCKLLVGRTGLEEWWGNLNALAVGDVVIPADSVERIVALAPLEFVEPPPAVTRQNKWNVPELARRAREESEGIARELQQYLLNRMRGLYVPVVAAASIGSAESAGATHVLYGTVSPRTTKTSVVEVSISPVGEKIGVAAGGHGAREVIDQFEFEASRAELGGI